MVASWKQLTIHLTNSLLFKRGQDNYLDQTFVQVLHMSLRYTTDHLFVNLKNKQQQI